MKYLVLLVTMGLFVGCGSDEADKEAPAEEFEPDLAPVRTFEATPADEPEPTVVPEPVKTEPVEPQVETPAPDLEKERDYIRALMGTLKLGDTWQSMIPEVRTLLLEKGDCKGNKVDEYVWCYITEYDLETKQWRYWYSVTFDPSKKISKLVDDSKK